MSRTSPKWFAAAFAPIAAALLTFGCGGSGATEGSGNRSPSPKIDDCGLPAVDVPKVCTSCHEAPPTTAGHPQNPRCSRCHGMVFGPDLTLVNPALHRNGKVDAMVGCNSCHGWDQGTAPPQDLTGSCDPNRVGVGAHKAMRMASIPAHRVNCANCHVVPLQASDPGHIDGTNKAKVVFGMLATANGAKPTWDGVKCSGVYCHGATLKGGTLTSPSWLDTSHAPSRCGACHGLSDPDGDTHANCSPCHPSAINPDGTLIPNGTHLNGVVDLTEGTARTQKKGARR